MNDNTPSESKAFTRRSFLQVAGASAAAVGIAGFLASCVPGDPGGSQSPSENLLAQKPKGKLTIGTYKDPSFALIPSLLIPQFEKETGVTVEWLEQDYGTWFEKAVNDAQSGVGAFDIYILDDPWMPQFASNGLVRDLSGSGLDADDDIVGSALETAYWPPRSGPVPPDQQGKKSALFGLPFLSDTPILSYRKDIFEAAPTTFQEIVAAAEAKGDPQAGRYGWVFRGAKGNPAVTSWFTTLYSAGGRFFDDDWAVRFNDTKGLSALEYQLSLLQYCPPNIGEFDSDQEGAALLNGNAFGANLWTGWAANALDPSKSQVADRIGFGVPPAITTPTSELGIQIAAISRSSSNPVAAAHFIDWITSKATQLDFARAGGTPARTTAFQDAQAQAKTPYLQAVAATLDVAKARSRTPLWNQVEDQLGTQLNIAFTTGAGADAGGLLDTAAQQVEQLLEQSGYYR